MDLTKHLQLQLQPQLNVLAKWCESLSLVQLGTISFCAGVSLGYISFKILHRKVNKRKVYPPGPPKDPLIGNLRNFPKGRMYETFCEWQKLYGASFLSLLIHIVCSLISILITFVLIGDIVYVQLPGISLMIVNSLDLSHELLSKRTDINSGRTISYMVTELYATSFQLTCGLLSMFIHLLPCFSFLRAYSFHISSSYNSQPGPD
jgi:hypothetical protein